MRYWILIRHGLEAATVGKPVEFKRISLTGFRSCTSRSRYQSVSKQTTRSRKPPTAELLMLTLEGLLITACEPDDVQQVFEMECVLMRF
ncbi:hypothetical protein Tco_0213858 [Tanacetum coccineum]